MKACIPTRLENLTHSPVRYLVDMVSANARGPSRGLSGVVSGRERRREKRRLNKEETEEVSCPETAKREVKEC